MIRFNDTTEPSLTFLSRCLETQFILRRMFKYTSYTSFKNTKRSVLGFTTKCGRPNAGLSAQITVIEQKAPWWWIELPLCFINSILPLQTQWMWFGFYFLSFRFHEPWLMASNSTSSNSSHQKKLKSGRNFLAFTVLQGLLPMCKKKDFNVGCAKWTV